MSLKGTPKQFGSAGKIQILVFGLFFNSFVATNKKIVRCTESLWQTKFVYVAKKVANAILLALLDSFCTSWAI